jgi:hypothetical protein
LIWTPLLLFSVVGIFIFWRRNPQVGSAFLAAMLAFYLLIACYPDWAGISSYGNRFFVSLTPLFVIGLAVFLDRIAKSFQAVRFHSPRTPKAIISAVLACFILWNLAFMFQWGTHLVPARGPISWRGMIGNQFTVVPRQISAKLENYLLHRSKLMRQIEDRDIEQMKNSSEP